MAAGALGSQLAQVAVARPVLVPPWPVPVPPWPVSMLLWAVPMVLWLVSLPLWPSPEHGGVREAAAVTREPVLPPSLPSGLGGSLLAPTCSFALLPHGLEEVGTKPWAATFSSLGMARVLGDRGTPACHLHPPEASTTAQSSSWCLWALERPVPVGAACWEPAVPLPPAVHGLPAPEPRFLPWAPALGHTRRTAAPQARMKVTSELRGEGEQGQSPEVTLEQCGAEPRWIWLQLCSWPV